MFTVGDISSDAKRILANCDDATLLNRLNYAVEQLASEADWDPLLGVVDIPITDVTQRVVTLPREVEMVLAVNIDGTPAKARDRFFSFHLNGPGDLTDTSVNWVWDDKGDFPILVDPTVPVRLAAYCNAADFADAEMWAYGYDANGKWLRTNTAPDTYVDGVPVPIYSNLSLPPSSPTISRIVRIRKNATKFYVTLKSYPVGSTTGTTLGDYAPNELEPSYRRITIDRPANSVRVSFRRSVFELTSTLDLIPLHSQFSILMMLKSLQKYENDNFDEGDKYFNLAVKALTKEQLSRRPVTTPEFQVRGPLINSRRDRLD